MSESLNVILPCAGNGLRLGLPYPKEIHKIEKDVSMIDFSFRLLLPHADRISRVSITLTKQKTDIVKYLDKYKGMFNLCFTYFNENYSEWAGSILSAENLFLEKNVVLLPDSVLTDHPDYPLIPSMDLYLEREDIVFGYLKERGERLRSLGAMQVDEANGDVIQFCDKPIDAIDRFNCFWTAFGFRKSVSVDLLNMMMQSIRKEKVDITKVGKAKAFPVNGYLDLGTWESLAKFHPL